MSYIETEYPDRGDKASFYDKLKEQLLIYTGDETDVCAVLSNASAVIAQAFGSVNWVGFYIARGDELVLGPFQGKPAVSRIGFGLGVCGAAWRDGEPKVVADVGCFEGHIACDCNSRSELVIPLLRANGSFFGVLDMDSVEGAYFTDDDSDGLISALGVIERKL